MKKIIEFFRIFKKYKKLEYLAFHDCLTGLLNRTWLYENLNSISKKYVYFIDINNLHEINKQGHTIGDNHIKKIVATIQYNLNKSDIFVRYAGDEFIVFSNEEKLLHCTELYAVGYCPIYNDIKESIMIADNNMLKFKNNRK